MRDVMKTLDAPAWRNLWREKVSKPAFEVYTGVARTTYCETMKEEEADVR